MMTSDAILSRMIEYFEGDVRRINHALKVYGFARSIAAAEGLADEKLFTVEAAAILHDIGIRESERKYNSSAGKYQELEGPPVAQRILNQLGVEERLADRICFLIGHHHTYPAIDDDDFQILVEADFLVNIFEEEMSAESIGSIESKYFKTRTGTGYLKSMYGTAYKNHG